MAEKEYIEREAAETAIRNDLQLSTWMKRSIDKAAHAMGVTVDAIEAIPSADVVEVDDVAKMLTWLFADHCPCNYNGIDEWLPYVCELSNECPYPKDKLGCWEQFIKHHKAKMDEGADDAAD